MTACIGFIGAGNMGFPMIEHLSAAGFTLQVFARRPQTKDQLKQLNIPLCSSPQAAAQGAQFILTNVTTTEDVEEVILGPQGVIHSAAPDSAVIDMSTISAVATRQIAEQLQHRQIHMLDAPVSGGVKGAQSATLSIMVGGKTEVLERCRPLLSCLGTTITHIGDHGAGQIAKACNQIVQVINIAGIAEAMHFCKQFGVDPQKMLPAIAAGMAGSKMLDLMGPKMADRNFVAGIEARLHHKDLALVDHLIADQHVMLPTLSTVLKQLDTLMEQGWGYDDTASLLRVLELPLTDNNLPDK